ncbi:MAG: S8 family serine peptidase [Silicimonas sp.]|nr:S8 family serine peptidase [Silicimonas sp.]
MSLTWSEWTDDPCAGPCIPPYIDWLKTVTFEDTDEKDGLSIAPLPLSPMAAEIAGVESRPAPLPPFARKPDDENILATPAIELDWTPSEDCAIVAVIDSAIALSHARFRHLDGGTRFLAAWLMNGKWRPSAVPFGRELFQKEIKRLMFGAKIGGNVDESAFDRAAGLTQFGDMRGDRRLENNGTHGTLVADLAAGFDVRQSSDDEHRRRLPLIAVGLPPRSSMGSSGSFLEFFAMHALEYIVDRADAVWTAVEGDKAGGYPIVINLSYGLQAGPKDGEMLIEKLMRALLARAEQMNRQIRIILPAGNDLLSEGAALFDLTDGDVNGVEWRIKPEDHTPNYAEVWSDVIKGDGGSAPEHPLSLMLAPPSGPVSPATPGRAGQMTTLKDAQGRPVARIYCRAHDNRAKPGDTPDWHRVGYVLCTAPTLPDEPRLQRAPAGAWRLGVSAAEATKGYAYVQSDQSLTFGSNTGLVSTFAHPDFEPFDATGRYIDIADYPYDGSKPKNTDVTPPMRRHDTMNTIAHLKEARVIGSYRKTDGKPSLYSSASSEAVGNGRAAPSALLPGEDGAARFGLMGAGSKSGSATAMAGTSFSTGLATRAVALAMLDWLDDKTKPVPGDEPWFAAQAAKTAGQFPGQTVKKKAGAGRLFAPDTGRVER